MSDRHCDYYRYEPFSVRLSRLTENGPVVVEMFDLTKREWVEMKFASSSTTNEQVYTPIKIKQEIVEKEPSVDDSRKRAFPFSDDRQDPAKRPRTDSSLDVGSSSTSATNDIDITSIDPAVVSGEGNCYHEIDLECDQNDVSLQPLFSLAGSLNNEEKKGLLISFVESVLLKTCNRLTDAKKLTIYNFLFRTETPEKEYDRVKIHQVNLSKDMSYKVYFEMNYQTKQWKRYFLKTSKLVDTSDEDADLTHISYEDSELEKKVGLERETFQRHSPLSREIMRNIYNFMVIYNLAPTDNNTILTQLLVDCNVPEVLKMKTAYGRNGKPYISIVQFSCQILTQDKIGDRNILEPYIRMDDVQTAIRQKNPKLRCRPVLIEDIKFFMKTKKKK